MARISLSVPIYYVTHDIFIFIPESFVKLINIYQLSGFIEGIWTLLVFPLLVWSFLGVLAKHTKGADRITDAWRKLALPLVIIISAGHLTKAVAKLNAWINFLPGSINDPSGLSSLKYIADGIGVPGLMVSNQIVSIIGLFLLSTGFIYLMREEKIINKNSFTRLIPKLVLFILYGIIVMGIGLSN
ncbi:MAG: hypothetical protein KGZ42_12530 [Melioribacter sp.]|nr:hypothetical protein [Melioribacter sp.]